MSNKLEKFLTDRIVEVMTPKEEQDQAPDKEDADKAPDSND